MIHGDDDIGVSYGAAYHGSPGIVEVHLYLPVVGALDAVANNYVTPCGEWVIAVAVCRLDMVGCVGTLTVVQCVAVGEKGLASPGSYHSGYDGSEVGPEVGQVARLTEMDLDGGHLAVEVDLKKACRLHQLLQLLQQVERRGTSHIGKVHHGRLHLYAAGHWSDVKNVDNVNKMLFQSLVLFHRFSERDKHYLIALQSYHHALLPVEQRLNGSITQSAGIDTVECRR